MAGTIDGLAAAIAHAATLPDTERSTYYGQPAVRVASNGRVFLGSGHEPATAFVLLLDRDTVDLLMATDPATFFQTSHYAGAAAVLVRFGSADPERVRATIARARDQAAALRPVKPRRA